MKYRRVQSDLVNPDPVCLDFTLSIQPFRRKILKTVVVPLPLSTNRGFVRALTQKEPSFMNKTILFMILVLYVLYVKLNLFWVGNVTKSITATRVVR